MKRLAYYSLEGLLRQGPHEVWVTLGTYDSAEKVDEVARGQRVAKKPGIVATRVMPCYRSRENDTALQATVA